MPDPRFEELVTALETANITHDAEDDTGAIARGKIHVPCANPPLNLIADLDDDGWWCYFEDSSASSIFDLYPGTGKERGGLTSDEALDWIRANLTATIDANGTVVLPA